ncbi:hypothetical protein cce_3159 [Crocosphaera subtropica ATCC 51142]|uniref:Antitoxin n=1 Tax=Crocosphaera subtropica (strain ATCC 51142 / BH68) TaxID=43989 RepID=B1WXG6_CROS5|nr:hypothetical protein [Crocosphaera subtropica]ACB52507.1 hypothetical protein cce_3159 [Crocosphaera subtropica ATCC 51142]
MTFQDYPFAQKLITDTDGNICQVIMDFTDYQKLLETLEDEGLYRAIMEVRQEKPLTVSEALEELEKS